MTIANSIVLSDNAYGTIGSSLAVGDTTLTFTTGHGARFPAVAAGQVLYACILDSTNILEEVAITAHTAGADTATMTRAAGGTSAKAWTSGSRVEVRVSSTVLKRLQLEGQLATTLTTADGGATYTGSMSVAALGYITGVVYSLTLAATNSGTAPTIALDGLSAITVKLDGGGALAIGQLPLQGLYKFDGTNFILLNAASGSQSINKVFASPASGSSSAGSFRALTGADGAGLVLIQAQTAANAASVDFTSGIDTTYDDYVLVCTKVIPQTDNTDLYVRFSTDGGSTFKSTNEYHHSRQSISAGGIASQAGAAAAAQALIASGLGTDIGEVFNGVMHFQNLSDTVVYKSLHGTSHYFDQSASHFFLTYSATLITTSAINAIRVLMSSGNINGRYALYGVRKA